MKTSFVTRATMLAGVGLVLSTLLLSSCAPQSTAAPTAQAPSAPLTQTSPPVAPALPTDTLTPTPLRCVRVAITDNSGTAQTNDPAFTVTTDDGFRIHNIYDPFIAVDNNLNPQPALAASWEKNTDASVWLFHLRQGVKFSNGAPLTAADVVYTYKRLIDPNVGSAAASTLSFLTGATIAAVDDNTVKFAFDSPKPELPIMLTGLSSYIVPNGADAQTLKMQGIGTGPFVMTNFQPNSTHFRLDANPNYWGGAPKVPCIEEMIIPEATTRIAALLKGDVDIIVQVDVGQIASLKTNPDIVIQEVKGATSYGMPFWVDTPPFNNAHVRNALKMAADRQQLVNIVLLGYGVAGIDSPLPPTSPYAHTQVIPAQDIPGCKAELVKAGYSNGIDLTLYTSTVLPGFVELAEAYKEQAVQCGIRVTVVQASPDTYWDQVWLKKSWVVSGWTALPVYQALTIATLSNSTWNDTHFYNKDFDQLMTKAASTVDDTARTQMYQQASKMIADDGGFLTTIFLSNISANRSNIIGYHPSIMQAMIDMRSVSFK
jgi:peptide/nickel transport system substrate-binding protein